MPDADLSAPTVNPVAGFWGKLPAHGDFVRRGLDGAAAAALDDWLQAALADVADPDALLTTMPARRFAATALLPERLAVGVMIGSRDSVGREWPLVALRLLPAGPALPASPPGAWDDWAARAEAMLVAARDEGWTAPALGEALAASARADVLAQVPAAPWEVASAAPGLLCWHGAPEGCAVRLVEGLPRGAAFAALFDAAVDGEPAA